MPIYEYQCNSCGRTVEKLQSFDDDPPAECDECGAEGSLERLVSEAGVVFKGSGFYATDNRSNGATNGAATTSNGTSEAAGESEEVTESADAASGCCGGSCGCATD